MDKKYHIGAQNDMLYIIYGEAPSKSNDDPRHDADREAVASVYNDDLAHDLIEKANEYEQLQQENTELKKENAALKEYIDSGASDGELVIELKSQLEALQAHVNTLLSAITFYAGDDRAKIAKEALRLVPEQSLNHIEARVEEETIERIQAWLSTEETIWFDAEDAVRSIPNIPRKYAKHEKE